MAKDDRTHYYGDGCPEHPAEQMAFDEVVDSEPVAGDPEYNAWIAAGRPKVGTD